MKNRILTMLLFVLLAVQAKAGYDPAIQRWITQDPIGEAGGVNLYQFNYNNPVNYFDPDGKNPLIVLFIAGAVWGGTMTPYVANTPGYIAPGVPEPTYPAVTTDAILGNALMGGILNVGVGGAGMLTDGGLPSVRPSTCPVSRWGKQGPLESGDWIMPGEQTWLNYRLSFKWEKTPWNQYAPPESGQTFPVSPNTIRWPSGLNFYKGAFGQRIYVGPSVPPITGSIVNAPPSTIRL